MSSNTYWTERLTKNQYKKHTKRMDKQVLKVYKEVEKELQATINDLWLKSLENGGELTAANMFAYGRYKRLQDDINKTLTKLGHEEINILNAH